MIEVRGSHRRAAIGLAVALSAAACDRVAEPVNAPRPLQQVARIPTQPAGCAATSTPDQLKALVLAEAKQLRPRDADAIEKHANAAAVRLDGPAVTGSDAALDVTLCSARLAMTLPQGVEDPFGGGSELAAKIRYAVQRTAIGGESVQMLQGAEPLVFRLAATGLTQAVAPAPASIDPAPQPAPVRIAVARVPAAAAARTRLREPLMADGGRTSFDCRLARSRTDRLVCADAQLAALDRVAASSFERRVARADRVTMALLRSSQAEFMARRDRCRRTSCIADRYRDRLDEIDAMAAR